MFLLIIAGGAVSATVQLRGSFTFSPNGSLSCVKLLFWHKSRDVELKHVPFLFAPVLTVDKLDHSGSFSLEPMKNLAVKHFQ